MIIDLVTYILKVNLIMAVLFLLYKAFMSRSTLHQYNRIYLLLTPVLALLVPFISFSSQLQEQFVIELPEIGLTGVSLAMESETFSVFSYIAGVWMIGLIIKLFNSLKHARSILSLVRSNSSNHTFTFLKKIVVSPELSDDVRTKVLLHEQVHADQLHTLDLIWYEVFSIVFWFNPVFKWAQFSLKELHEYIADKKTDRLTSGYAETIIAFAFGLERLPLASEFNSVNIKNRIKMMKKKTSKFQGAGIMMSFTLAVIAVFTISWTSVNTPADHAEQKTYKEVEKMPVFKGCDRSGAEKEIQTCSNANLMKYIINEVNYPKKSMKSGAEGKVMIEFVVNKKGEVNDVKVLKGVNDELDAESIRVIKSMPNWTAGEQDGKVVNVSMVLPINFKLSN